MSAQPGSETARAPAPGLLDEVERQLQHSPGDGRLWVKRGDALQELARPQEALASYQRALELGQGPAAHNNRGNALRMLGRLEEALESYAQALRLDPLGVHALNNRGNVLRDLGRPQEALASYQHALELAPRFALAHCNCGKVLLDLRRAGEALACFERALREEPEDGEAHFGRGGALLQLERAREALVEFEWLERRGPLPADALIGKASALARLQRHPEACRCLRQALALAPDYPYVRGSLLHGLLESHEWSGLDEEVAALTAAIGSGRRVTHPQGLLALVDSVAWQRRCAEICSADKYPPAARPLWQGERYAHERIRVAYVSADFGAHPVSFLCARMLERHDRERFEVLGVALRPVQGAAGLRIARAMERMEDASARTDEQVGRLLRDWQVDIAVDLMGYTQGMRLAIFAERAVPVQVSYLGYAGTLGAPYMDYLIADEVVIPRGEERGYTEQVVRLPGCYLPTDESTELTVPVGRTAVGLPESGVVYCGFATAYKLNPGVFGSWMRILREVPGSVLWLRGGSEETRASLRAEGRGHGIAPERLIFAEGVSDRGEHLGRLSLADLFLDTWPYNAHSTACEALWTGVPVLTYAGRSFAARVAGSAVHAAGLASELVRGSVGEYEQRAIELGREPGRLAGLKKHLRERRGELPLFDSARYTRQLEAAYARMWERAERGEPPLAFDVERVSP